MLGEDGKLKSSGVVELLTEGNEEMPLKDSGPKTAKQFK